jgi:hypothetical protein
VHFKHWVNVVNSPSLTSLMGYWSTGLSYVQICYSILNSYNILHRMKSTCIPFPQPRLTLPSSKKRKRGSGSDQRQAAISFSPPSEKHFTDNLGTLGAAGPTFDRLTFGAPQKMRTHGFYLIDTKTRHSRTMPVEADTLPAMIQLSLYKRLFDALPQRKVMMGFGTKCSSTKALRPTNLSAKTL